MNSTITLSQIITRLAKITNSDPNTTRRFLRVFFNTIEKSLAQGESVEIKHIGTFRRVSDNLIGNNVVFTPDPSLAQEINKPFSMFHAVELADSITDDDLSISLSLPSDEEQEIPETEKIPEISETENNIETDNTTPSIPNQTDNAEEEEIRPVQEIESDESQDFEHVQSEENNRRVQLGVNIPFVDNGSSSISNNYFVPEDDDPTEEETQEEEPKKKGSLTWLWIIITGIIIGVGGGLLAAFLAYPDNTYSQLDEIEETQEEIIAPTDSISAIVGEQEENITTEAIDITDKEPAAPAQTAQISEETTKEPVYETVSGSNYLAVMARRHYGKSIFWVYIYLANQDKLKHPSKIAPGTRVRIPDISELPQASSKEEATRMAEKKAAEIMANVH